MTDTKYTMEINLWILVANFCSEPYRGLLNFHLINCLVKLTYSLKADIKYSKTDIHFTR